MGLLKKSAVLLAGAMLSAQSMALGLGEISLDSALNQPLKAQIQLLDASSYTHSELRPKLASPVDFERAGIDRYNFLNNIKLEVKDNQILVSTKQPVSEPFLNFLVELNWPTGRVLREYTLLLDPPTYVETPVKTLVTPPAFQPQEVIEPEAVVAPVEPAPWDVASQPGTYRVMPGDTLWNIAIETMPEGVNDAKKMMLALQKLNPDSFIKNNINLVKAHTELMIPDADTVNQISRTAAVSEVVRQTKVWSTGTAEVAQLDATDSASTVSAQGESSGGEVRLVSPSSNSSASNASGAAQGNSESVSQDDLAVALEQLDESVRKNQELSQRIDMLAEQLEQAQRLLTLQNEQLAQLQGQEVALPETSATTELEADSASETVTDATESQIESIETGVATAEENSAAVTETDTADETVEQPATAQEVATAVEKSSAQPIAPAPIAKQPTLIEQALANLELILGALAVIILLIALALYAATKRRQSTKDEDVLDEIEAADDDQQLAFEDEDDLFGSDFDDLGDEDFDFGDEPSPAEDTDKADHGSDQSIEDLLKECDAYIAYGKFDQAVELIKQAVDANPERADFRLKLLEILASLDEAESFAYAEKDLLSLNDESASQKARELRSQLSDPMDIENLPAIDEQANDQNADESLDTNEIDSEGLNLDLDSIDAPDLDLGDDGSFDFVIDTDLDTSLLDTQDESESSSETSSDMGLELGDIEFDLGTNDQEVDQAESAGPVESQDEDFELGDLDLDLDLDVSSDEPTSDAENSIELPEQEPDSESTSSDFEADYEVDMDDVTELDSSIDFELDEELATPEVEEIQDTAALMEEMDSSLDEMLLDFPDSSENNVEINDESDLDADDELDAEIGEILDSTDDVDEDITIEVDELQDLDLSTEEADDALVDDEEFVLDTDSIEDDITLEEAPAADDVLDLGESEDSVEAIESDDDEPATEESDSSELSSDSESDLESGLDLDELSGEEDDFDFLEGTDEIGTKLDLARAYIDMDDVDGAKDLLKEVSQEGNAEQKQEAKDLLDKLS